MKVNNPYLKKKRELIIALDQAKSNRTDKIKLEQLEARLTELEQTEREWTETYIEDLRHEKIKEDSIIETYISNSNQTKLF